MCLNNLALFLTIPFSDLFGLLKSLLIELHLPCWHTLVRTALNRNKIVQFFQLILEVLVFNLESSNPLVISLYNFLGAVCHVIDFNLSPSGDFIEF